MNKHLQWFFLASSATLLTACQPTPTPVVPEIQQETKAAKVIPEPKATPDQWRSALASTYEQTGLKDDGNGQQKFSACFEKGKEGKKCDLFSLATRDAFLKVHFFTPWRSSWHGRMNNYLSSDIAVPDCGKPKYVLRPYYFSKNGWLFMNKVSVLLDGELVLDLELDANAVKRENETSGVEERDTLIADAETIMALRKIATGKKAVIRLTGKSGYVTVAKKESEDFIEDVADGLAIFDRLQSALKGKTLEKCI